MDDRRCWERWRGVFGAALVLLVGSALPLPARFNPDLGPLGPDRFLHALGHLALAAALAGALDDGRSSAPTLTLAVCVSTAYGVCTELLQKWIPGRSFERGDVVAGVLGSVVGVVAWRRVAERPGPTAGSSPPGE